MPPTQSNTIISYTVTGLNQVQAAIPVIQALSNANNLLARSMNTLTRAANRATPAVAASTAVFNQLNPAFATAGANTATLATAVNNTAVALQNANAKTQTFLISWQSVVRIMIGSAISRFIGMVIRSFERGAESAMEFQKRISEIRTVGQDSINTFDYWANSVRNLSDAFAMPLLDVAEAQYQTLSNQIGQGANAVRFMDEALRFATITVSSAADSVDLLSGIMNAYGLSVNEARDVSDQFFRSIELGRFRAQDVADSIGRLTVLGSQVGVSMGELNAAMATLSVQGISPEQTMTALRNILLKLAKPTDAMIDLFEEWGVSTGEAAIRTFTFSGVLEKLAQKAAASTSPLSELADIFKNIRPTIGAAGLANAFDKYNEFLDKIKNSAKNADEALKFMRETPRYEIVKELQKISNFFVVDLGQKILGNVASFSKEIIKLSDAVKILTSSLAALGKIFAISLSATAIYKFVAAVWVSVAALKAYIYALGLAGGATLAFLATPGVGTFAAIAAGIYLLADAYYKSQRKLSESLIASFKGLTEASREALNNSIAEYHKWANETIGIWTRAIRQQEGELNRFVAELQRHINYIKEVATAQLEMQDMILATQEKLLSGPELFKTYMDFYNRYKEMEKKFLKAGKYDEAKQALERMERIIDKISNMKGITIPVQTGRPVEMRGGQYTNQGVSAQEFGTGLRRELLASELELTKARGKGVDYTRELAKLDEEAPERLREQLKIHEDINATIKQYQDQVAKNKESMMAAIANVKQYIDTLYDNLYNKLLAVRQAPSLTMKPIDRQAAADAVRQLKDLKDILSMPGARTTPDLADRLANLKTILATLGERGYIKTDDIKVITNHLNSLFSVMDNAVGKREQTLLLLDEIKKLSESLPDITATMEGPLREMVAAFDLVDKIGPGVIGNIDLAAARTYVLANAIAKLTAELEKLNIAGQNALSTSKAKTQGAIQPTEKWVGGYINRFAKGGVASDQIPAYLSRGEVVMNQMASRKYLPMLLAMNAGTRGYSGGGPVTNVGDINISVQGGNTSDVTLRNIGAGLRRELKRKTLRLD